MKRRVIKIGGSLFGLRNVETLVRKWLDQQPPAQNVLVAGGGKLVDSIRDWQNNFELDDSTCHWMSIDAMSLTARLVQTWFVESVSLKNFDEVEVNIDSLVVFDCSAWMHEKEDVPESWAVTSDSIAALLAVDLGADELVLLKPALPKAQPKSLAALSQTGMVDRYFQFAAAGLPRIRVVDLLAAGKEIELPLEKNQLH